MSVSTFPNMDRVVREAAELAYTTLQLRIATGYFTWHEQSRETQGSWCEAIEVALSYALKTLFPQEPHDDAA